MDDLHDLALTAERAVADHAAAPTSTSIRAELRDRHIEFISAEKFAEDFGATELDKLVRLSVHVWDFTTTEAVNASLDFGSFDAAYLSVEGTSRTAVDATLALLEEKLEKGRRRFNMPFNRLYWTCGVVTALVALLVGTGIMALADAFTASWWIIVLSGVGVVAVAVGLGLTGLRASRYLAPELELRKPGDPTRWEKFRAGSLRTTERFVWLAVGAGLTLLVNLLT